jgi:hypothetical protein
LREGKESGMIPSSGLEELLQLLLWTGDFRLEEKIKHSFKAEAAVSAMSKANSWQ